MVAHSISIGQGEDHAGANGHSEAVARASHMPAKTVGNSARQRFMSVKNETETAKTVIDVFTPPPGIR